MVNKAKLQWLKCKSKDWNGVEFNQEQNTRILVGERNSSDPPKEEYYCLHKLLKAIYARATTPDFNPTIILIYPQPSNLLRSHDNYIITDQKLKHKEDSMILHHSFQVEDPHSLWNPFATFACIYYFF